MAEPAKKCPIARLGDGTEIFAWSNDSKTKGYTTAPLDFALYAALKKVATELSSIAEAVCTVMVLLSLVLFACVFTGIFAGFDEGIWALSILFGMVLGLVLARVVVLDKVRG